MPEHNRADENRCRSTQDRRRLHRRSQCVASGCRDRQPRRRSR
jgi:hypothetical protein